MRCFCQSAFAFSGLFKTGLVSFEDSAAKKHQALTSDIRLEHLQIYSDTTKMQQVVTNIQSNAVKYTPDGGTISITVTERDCHEFCVHGIIGARYTGTPHEHDYQETNLS